MKKSIQGAKVSFFFKSLLLLFIFQFTHTLKAQTSNAYFFEPAVELNFATDSPWSYSFAVANRALLGENISGEKVSDYTNVHIEVSPFVAYQTSDNSAIALGFRYRFREIYDEFLDDRFKFVEEYSYAHPNSLLNFAHRARLEQKFRIEETIFSFRYRLGISQALNEVFGVGLSTEALYHVSAESKPDAEQRFTLEFENSSFDDINLSVGFEYRMGNYLNDLENEYFFLAGIGLNL